MLPTGEYGIRYNEILNAIRKTGDPTQPLVRAGKLKGQSFSHPLIHKAKKRLLLLLQFYPIPLCYRVILSRIPVR